MRVETFNTTAPRDFGPIYRETDMSRFPVEPWATFSNLIFLIVVIYWFGKVRFDIKKHPLLSMAMPILMVGFIGGVVYHATRSHRIWLLLDFMPILILVLMTGVYLWQLLFNNWALTLAATLGPVFSYRIFFAVIKIPENIQISLGYTVLALSILFPAILHCAIRNRRAWPWLTASFATFTIAITMRQVDNGIGATLPMGTHFLWHIFGGISTFLLIGYIYSTDIERTTPVQIENRELSDDMAMDGHTITRGPAKDRGAGNIK